MRTRFIWWPVRLSEFGPDKFWHQTDKRAWLEWVRVVTTVWGDTFYVKLDKQP